jgi:Na+/H+ antiporter NhaA
MAAKQCASCACLLAVLMAAGRCERVSEKESLIAIAKLGILGASLISAVLGYLVLHYVLPSRGHSVNDS